MNIARSIENHPLSRKQKGILSAMFAKAFARAQAHHAIEDGVTLEDWRHAECTQAAGVRISEAKQRHYLPLKVHAETLLGNSGAAFKSQMREENEETLRAPLRKLIRDCIFAFEPYGMTDAYAHAIARDKFRGVKDADLTADQLEQWLMTLRARGGSMRAKQMAKPAITAQD